MQKKLNLTRRELLTSSAVAGGVLTLMGPGMNLAAARGSDTIRVGVIGCGRRGAAAARNCVKSSEGVEVVALADAFRDNLSKLQKSFAISPTRCFVGMDSYKKLMALADVNLVILATPPAFRPVQFAEAVNQGKHVFMEAPAAICPAGIKIVVEAAQKAARKALAVVAGTQRRHDPAYVETMKRIHGGAIGKLINAHCYWNQGRPKASRRKSGVSDVAWQIRNWPYFRWLSGDLIVERHVHNLDVINWAFQAAPDMVHSLGGQQDSQGPESGNTYDHFGTEFTYGDVRTISLCRSIEGTDELIGERVVGTKGASNCCGVIEGENAWRYQGPKSDPYVQEHADLIKSIRAGSPLNEGKQIADSTLTAVMARESAYLRQQFKRSWFVSKATVNLLPPEGLRLGGARKVPGPVVPGKYSMGGLGGTPDGKKGGRKGKGKPKKRNKQPAGRA